MKYVFNDFSLDVKSRLLSKGDKTIKLEPKVFELLLYFCQRPNLAISREQLITDVWQNRIVSYAAINRAVGELRKVVEEQAAKPKIIITVSKVGYLFDGHVTIDSEEDDGIEEVIKSNATDGIAEIESQEIVAINQNTVVNTQKVTSDSRMRITKVIIAVCVVMILTLFFWGKTKAPQPLATLSIEKPLTALKGSSFRGDLSETGEELVFLHKAQANDIVQVWLKKQGKTAERLSVDDNYYTFAIFAGSDSVLATRFNNLDERQCEIVNISLKTKVVEKVFDCAKRAVTHLSYSPITRTIYFNYRRSITSAFNIYSYQLDTQSIQQLTFSDITAEHGDFTLALSPSEKQLAVLEYRDKHQALLKFIGLNNKKFEVILGPEFSANSRISWLSEHQVLVADGDRLQAYNLLTEKMSVLGGSTSIGFAKAHAATNTIIFDKGKTIANIYQYPLTIEKVQNKKAITNSSFLNYQMQFANLSKKIAYLSTDSGEFEIFIKREGEQKFNTHFPEPVKVRTNLDWSSNDELLVAGINHRLYLYDVKKDKWRMLLADDNSIHYVHFIDDENIAFSSKKSGQWQIWQVNLTTEKATQVTTLGGYSMQYNSNEEAMYITKYNVSGIFKLDLRTGTEIEILPHHKITSWNKWQLRGNKIYYINKKSLHQLDLDTQNDRVISTFELKAPVSFSVSFDHSVLQRELVESSSANIWLTKIE
jgi:DNA-binding winged helix-turn-helix (wHTH) protein/Tol biopolymer transport system component